MQETRCISQQAAEGKLVAKAGLRIARGLAFAALGLLIAVSALGQGSQFFRIGTGSTGILSC